MATIEKFTHHADGRMESDLYWAFREGQRIRVTGRTSDASGYLGISVKKGDIAVINEKAVKYNVRNGKDSDVVYAMWRHEDRNEYGPYALPTRWVERVDD